MGGPERCRSRSRGGRAERRARSAAPVGLAGRWVGPVAGIRHRQGLCPSPQRSYSPQDAHAGPRPHHSPPCRLSGPQGHARRPQRRRQPTTGLLVKTGGTRGTLRPRPQPQTGLSPAGTPQTAPESPSTPWQATPTPIRQTRSHRAPHRAAEAARSSFATDPVRPDTRTNHPTAINHQHDKRWERGTGQEPRAGSRPRQQPRYRGRCLVRYRLCYRSCCRVCYRL